MVVCPVPCCFALVLVVDAKDAIINQIIEVCRNNRMLPTFSSFWQVMEFDANVIVGESFPVTIFLLLDEHRNRLAQEMLAEQATMLLVEIQQTLTTGLFDLVFD